MKAKNNGIIQKLVSIGFKEYEARIFTVLMRGVPLSASEIAKEAGLIRNSIYDTLKSFAEKGYCNEIETNTINKYQLIDPLVILDKVEKEYNESTREKVSILKTTFTEINKSYKENKNSELNDKDSVELIRGFNKHRVSKYIELLNSAKNEITGMYRLKGLVSDEIDDLTKQFIKKGGTVRSIYSLALDFKVLKNGSPVNAKHEDLIKVCVNFEKMGEKLRLSEAEIPNMVIIDKSKVYVNIMGDSKINKNKQADLIVNDKAYAKNMIDLFEHYWNNSITISRVKSQ